MTRTEFQARIGGTGRDRPKLLFGAVAVAILVLAIRDLPAAGPNVNGYGGVDYRLYMDVTARWLAGGAFYEPYQLAAPYSIQAGDVLYPPVSIWLFAPFLFLPAALWWIIPLGVTCWAVWRMRPTPVVWPFIALCVAWPPTIVKIVTGNPVIWVVMAMALGCLYRWPSVFVLLKPSLAPFAAFGIRARSWWLALALYVAMSIPFTTMWGDWLTTLINARGGGIAYSIQEIPMLLFPLVAWAGRTVRPTPDRPRA